MDKCSICEKHKSSRDFVIHEEQDLIISHMPIAADASSAFLGYFFIEPKSHCTRFEELSDRQAELIGLWLRRLSLAHTELLKVKRTYFFKFADITPHFHIHVYPRPLSTPNEIVGEAVRHWSNAPQGTRADIIELCQKMKGYFQ